MFRPNRTHRMVQAAPTTDHRLLVACAALGAATLLLPLTGSSAKATTLADVATATAQDAAGMGNVDLVVEEESGRTRTCSGQLVALPGATPESKALVLTAGHCVSLENKVLPAGPLPSQEGETRSTKILSGGEGDAVSVQLTKLLYSSMKGIDMALIETDTTYGNLADKNIKPRGISDQLPAAGTQGTLASGHFKYTQSCNTIETGITLREGDWQWDGAAKVKNGDRSCGFRGGVSGSSIIDNASGLVTLVANTVAAGSTPCALNNPCEVPAGGGEPTSIQGAEYGQPANRFMTCTDGAGQLDLTKEGCTLPKA